MASGESSSWQPGLRVPRRTSSLGLPIWVILVATIVIAFAAAWIMETLQEHAIEDRIAQNKLITIEEDAAQVQNTFTALVDDTVQRAPRLRYNTLRPEAATKPPLLPRCCHRGFGVRPDAE